MAKPTIQQKDKLLRILGVSFGIAVTLGSTIGVGILRTPGTVAAQLGRFWLIIAIWTVGGVYALFGTVAATELATALPQAGGRYVYARAGHHVLVHEAFDMELPKCELFSASVKADVSPAF